MKNTWLLFMVLIFVASCAPSQDAIQTAIAQTQVAIPTITKTVVPSDTPAPTDTPIPTKTPLPTATNFIYPTSTPYKELKDFEISATLAALQGDTLDLLQKFFSDQFEIQSTNLVNFISGDLQVELVLEYMSDDMVKSIHFKYVSALCTIFGKWDEATLNKLTGGKGPFHIVLTTYSTTLDRKYKSITDYDTMVSLANAGLSFDDWVSKSGAGFVK